MAKDEYYTIVAKILAFLYQRLKGKENREVLDYVRANTEEFPIGEDYMEYVIYHMTDSGLIERTLNFVDTDGDLFRAELTVDTRITPEGIAFLHENSMIRKVASSIPIVSQIIGAIKG